jgi:uncharacterized protein YecE (DUF72 family)
LKHRRKTLDLDKFMFRGLDPSIRVGTASDRYSGWFDQIYTRNLYTNRITRRTNKIGGKSFIEEVLPVDSVGEYFQHFDVLEIDFTFYSPLLEEDQDSSQKYKPAQNYHVLKKYRQYMTDKDGVILKAPQSITAKRLYRSGKFVENETYLNPEFFTKQFYDPAVSILGPLLKGIVFEQEYHRKQDRVKVEDLATDLDSFFSSIPKERRYHLELRTESYLNAPVFDVMRKHYVGQVLSHWTWLPRLLKQFAKSGNSFVNNEECIVRLLTPRGLRYEDAYAKAHPFDRMIEGMLQPEMIAETTSLMKKAIENGVKINVIINNRAGGNAPLIAREIVMSFQ